MWNVFEAVQKTRSTCFFGSKNTAARFLNIDDDDDDDDDDYYYYFETRTTLGHSPYSLTCRSIHHSIAESFYKVL